MRLSVAALVLVVALAVRAGDESSSAVFSPTGTHRIENTIRAAIDGAQQSIDAAQFLLSDQEIADALVHAKERGVAVRVLVDGGMAKLHSSRDGYLAAHGIPTKRIGHGGATGAKFHHKFAVIDGSTALTGSANWSEDTELYNWENVVTLHDAAIAAAFAHEFESLFSHGEGGVGSTDDVLFAPTGWKRSLEKRISQEIGNAQKEVVAAIYQFTSHDIAAALADALGRGVRVSLLVDEREYPLSKYTIAPLVARGAQLKVVHVHGSGILAEKFHDKYAVIDGRTVLTGSFNWSPNQDRYGWDNLVVLRDPSLAKTYIADFASIWGSPVAH